MPPPERMQQRLPQRRLYTPGNRFEFDESKIPPGMTYQWHRVSLAGLEDQENRILSEMNGWVPVPAERHPELAGMRAAKGSEIKRGGLVLMEIPTQYAKESEDLEKFAARNTVETQIKRLGLQARQNGAKGISRSQGQMTGEEIE